MEIFRSEFQAMACLNELVVAADDEAIAQAAMSAAAQEVLRIEAKYSRYRADSVIGRLNAAAGSGKPIVCDEETLSLLRFAELLHRESAGLFDITAGVLRRAWDFRKAALPAERELAPLLALVGWDKLAWDGNQVQLSLPGMELDFGGFGKEYAADRAAVVLRQLGMRHGYVNLGGDIAAIGPQPDESPWLIGINDPRDPSQLIATLPLYQGGLATSGDYERYFELDGQRYCHILKPASGYPVQYWRSVSVLAPVCIAAGSLSTLAMLLEAAGLEFLRGKAVSYLAVNVLGDIHTSTSEMSLAQEYP